MSLSWAFLVFSSQHLSSNRKSKINVSDIGTFTNVKDLSDEDRALAYDSSLWNRIIDSIESKLEEVSRCSNEISKLQKHLRDTEDENGVDLTLEELQMLNQLKCHVLLHGNKLKLERPFSSRLPEHLKISQGYPSKALISNNYKNEYLTFLDSVQEEFSEVLGWDIESEVIDFYFTLGMYKQSEPGVIERYEVEDPEEARRTRSQRRMVYLNPLSHYFEDVNSHSSFIRLRRDHLEALGVQEEQAIEIDFYEY